LVFLPIGYISHFAGWTDAATFFINFLTIIPLSKLLGKATEEIALRTSDTIGGLLNATFGNAVELIISLFALNEGLIRVVQASLLGSIISNMLLVLGLCFLCGGWRFKEQRFGAESAQTSAAMLALAVLSLLIPATFDLSVGKQLPEAELTRLTLGVSRGTAIIMLVMYLLFLYFQLKTHTHLYNNVPDSAVSNGHSPAISSLPEEHHETPEMLLSVAVCCLIIVTVLVAVSAEFLVGSIEGNYDT
jgi:Ca2+:H+ antiporter